MLSHECFDNKTMGNILFICLLFYVVKLRNIINCIIIENASSNVIGCSLVDPWVFLECYLVVPWFFLSCWLPARLLYGYLVIPWVLLDCSWLLLVCWFACLLVCWFAGFWLLVAGCWLLVCCLLFAACFLLACLLAFCLLASFLLTCMLACLNACC